MLCGCFAIPFPEIAENCYSHVQIDFQGEVSGGTVDENSCKMITMFVEAYVFVLFWTSYFLDMKSFAHNLMGCCELALVVVNRDILVLSVWYLAHNDRRRNVDSLAICKLYGCELGQFVLVIYVTLHWTRSCIDDLIISMFVHADFEWFEMSIFLFLKYLVMHVYALVIG